MTDSSEPPLVTTDFSEKTTVVELPLDYLRDEYVEEFDLADGDYLAQED